MVVVDKEMIVIGRGSTPHLNYKQVARGELGGPAAVCRGCCGAREMGRVVANLPDEEPSISRFPPRNSELLIRRESLEGRPQFGHITKRNSCRREVIW